MYGPTIIWALAIASTGNSKRLEILSESGRSVAGESKVIFT